MRCTICSAGTRRRNGADRMLLKGASLAAVARKFGFSADAMGRHKHHVQLALVQAAGEKLPKSLGQLSERDYGASLLAEIADLKRDAHKLQLEATRRRELTVAIRCLHERLAIVEAQAKLLGAIPDAPLNPRFNFNVDVTPEMAQRIVNAYLATRPGAIVAPARQTPGAPALAAPELSATASPETPAPQNPSGSLREPAQSPAQALEVNGVCIESKSNGKIV